MVALVKEVEMEMEMEVERDGPVQIRRWDGRTMALGRGAHPDRPQPKVQPHCCRLPSLSMSKAEWLAR